MTKPDLSGPVPDNGDAGPVPAANTPGHHPEVEQDKPTGPPPRPHDADEAHERPARQEFRFRYEGPVGIAARAFTITERNAKVVIDGDHEQLVARYGPWTVTTPLTNVAEASMSGPYQMWKVLGPARLSFRDRGLTFATNNDRGVCILFHEPVAGIDPRGWIRHPGLTVTVEDPDALITAIARLR